MRQVVGRKLIELDPRTLRARAAHYGRVVVDVGTGAGSALLRRARRDPASFFIGVDAAADNMREASDRAQRQSSRGGVANAIFVVAAAGELPGDLAAIADEVTVVLPWGSLLHGVLEADHDLYGRLRDLLKPNGTLEMLISVAVSDVGAGSIDFDEDRAVGLAANLEGLGLRAVDVRRAEQSDVDRLGSSWGRRLQIPSRRQAWVIRVQTQQ